MFFQENTTASGQLRLSQASQEAEALSGREAQGPLPKLRCPGCWARQGTGVLGGRCAALPLPAPPAILPSPSCWLFPFPFPLLPPAPGAFPAFPPLESPQMGGEKWFSPCVTAPFSWLCFPCRMLHVLIYSLCFSRTYSDGILLSSIYGRETISPLSFQKILKQTI